MERETQIAEVYGAKPDYVLAVRQAIQRTVEAKCAGRLEAVSKALFHDFLGYLRHVQPGVSRSTFGRALGRSTSYITCLTSDEPEQRAKCAVYPHQYKRILAVFSCPGDFNSSSKS